MPASTIARRIWLQSENTPTLATDTLHAASGCCTLRCVYLLIHANDHSCFCSPGIAEVVDCGSDSFTAGSWVVANLPWSDYASLPVAELKPLAAGFAGLKTPEVLSNAFNVELRRCFKPIVMGLQNAIKITGAKARLLQVSIARSTVGVSRQNNGVKHVFQTGSAISSN